VAFGQDPALARDAHAYTLAQLPSVPFFFAFVALRSYLQAREIVRPALLVMLGANVLNLALVWALVFGELGLPRLGVLGAGIATGLCRASMLVALVWLVWRARLHADAWRPWSREALAPGGLAEVAGHGWPVALQLGLETWAFSTAALLAGRLGAVPLAAHTITLNMAALTFMVPLGVAQGAVTRVGNLVGARDFPAAQRAAWVALAVGAGFMAVAGVALLVLRAILPTLYTSDPAVVAAAVAIFPIAAAFQVFDGTQVVAGGVLRGMGTTRPAAAINLLGFWAIGLPLAAWLGLRAGLGLAGLWWGLAAGLALIASGLVAWVALRGPAGLAGRAAPSAAPVDLR
jgi:MATE family multidrug resistance protein